MPHGYARPRRPPLAGRSAHTTANGEWAISIPADSSAAVTVARKSCSSAVVIVSALASTGTIDAFPRIARRKSMSISLARCGEKK